MRKFMIFLGLCFWSLSCSCNPFLKDNEVKEPIELSPSMLELKSKVSSYCEYAKEAKDMYGFVHSVGDGLLFTALHESVCGSNHTLKAQVAPGIWCRHPTCPGSKPDFEVSPSRLSRDMQLGLYTYLYQNNLPEEFYRIIEFGRSNKWDMCDGHYRSEKEKYGRCILSLTLRATLYDLASNVGVVCDFECRASRSVFQVWDPGAKGYRAHLAVVHTDLRGRAQGGINDFQQDFLRAMATRESNNALYVGIHRSYAGGDMEDVVNYLLTSPKWPNDRLPTNKEYCTEYLFQRDEIKNDQEFDADDKGCVTYYTYKGRDNYEKHEVCEKEPGSKHVIEGATVNDDWYACEGDTVHSGTDFLYASARVLGLLRTK